jgi:hypothetical protein
MGSTTVYVAQCSVDCCNNYYSNNVIGCKRCITVNDNSFNSFNTQKVIQKQTGVSSSTYINNLVPYQVTKAQDHYKNQGTNYPLYAKVSSDRIHPSNMHNNMRVVNRNTSSLLGSRTSLKPGCLAPGGIGVDIKHNSYDRYLAKLKAKNLKPRNNMFSSKPNLGNKLNNISLFDYSWNAKCKC